MILIRPLHAVAIMLIMTATTGAALGAAEGSTAVDELREHRATAQSLEEADHDRPLTPDALESDEPAPFWLRQILAGIVNGLLALGAWSASIGASTPWVPWQFMSDLVPGALVAWALTVVDRQLELGYSTRVWNWMRTQEADQQ